MTSAQELLTTLERDGYVVVKSFLDKELVDRARRDLEAIYERDLEERKLRNADEALFTHGSTVTVLTPPSHLALRLPGKSKALDQCYEKILTDPETSKLIRGMAGDHIKFRDVNCRYMTGAYDDGDFLNPPHEWHRDSPGEFCIAICLNDVPDGDNAATAVLPGSHRYPWCPRWNALFGEPFYLNRRGKRGPKQMTRYNIFSRLLHRFYMKGATGANANAGDFYIFLNDTWHGRVPNKHGHRAMIVMAGGFPTDYPFPDDTAPFPPEVLDKLPPTYRHVVARDLPVNTDKTSIIHRMLAERKPDTPVSLFWWARKERELMMKVGLLGDRLYRGWEELRAKPGWQQTAQRYRAARSSVAAIPRKVAGMSRALVFGGVSAGRRLGALGRRAVTFPFRAGPAGIARRLHPYQVARSLGIVSLLRKLGVAALVRRVAGRA